MGSEHPNGGLPFTWRVVAVVLAVGVLGVFLIGLGSVRQSADLDIRKAEIDARLVRTNAAAHDAQELAQHDRAVVWAVCRAFHRRDTADADYLRAIGTALKTYGPELNAYQRHIAPVTEAHSKVMQQIAYNLDCSKLMEKALKEAPYTYPTVSP